MSLGTVQSCRRYPVKSLQGLVVDELSVGAAGIDGDRRHALREPDGAHVLSAKRVSQLLSASATDEAIVLPDGREVAYTDPAASALLSEWLGREVVLASTEQLAEDEALSYEMTFDPPDDAAEYYEIPVPAGTFLDLAAVHLVASATLEGCRDLRPDLDWDVRRFRPNLVLEVPGEPFIEDGWVGRQLRLGDEVVLQVAGPTVRCAMPLRAQPALTAPGGDRPALAREPELFAAMGELHTAFPNHLGAYADVVHGGVVRVGDRVELLDD